MEAAPLGNEPRLAPECHWRLDEPSRFRCLASLSNTEQGCFGQKWGQPLWAAPRRRQGAPLRAKTPSRQAARSAPSLGGQERRPANGRPPACFSRLKKQSTGFDQSDSRVSLKASWPAASGPAGEGAPAELANKFNPTLQGLAGAQIGGLERARSRLAAWSRMELHGAAWGCMERAGRARTGDHRLLAAHCVAPAQSRLGGARGQARPAGQTWKATRRRPEMSMGLDGV